MTVTPELVRWAAAERDRLVPSALGGSADLSPAAALERVLQIDRELTAIGLPQDAVRARLQTIAGLVDALGEYLVEES